MTLRELGEDAVVAALTRGLPLGPQVRAGAGDDCAVLGGPRGRIWRLLKTDAVVEGVHFRANEKMHRVGWKALCRAISDIAAMGGVPREALVSVAISPDAKMAKLEELYVGLKKAARAFGVSIVGGETSRSPGPLFVSITLTGEVERKRCTLRSGGQPGDALYVSGRLGGTLAKKHLDFRPRLTEARWLTERFRVHAMMDVSDGLGADLPRLLAASECGVELWEKEIPRRVGCTLEQAMGDGEDFELLFTVAPKDRGRLLTGWFDRFPRTSLTQIGWLREMGAALKTTRGFDHFA